MKETRKTQVMAPVAEELFFHRKITAVGVELIAEHSGVTELIL